MGRIFLARASPSEFAAAMTAAAALPQALLGVATSDAATEAVRDVDSASLGDATAELLQSALRAACDPGVRLPQLCRTYEISRHRHSALPRAHLSVAYASHCVGRSKIVGQDAGMCHVCAKSHCSLQQST